MKAIVVEQTGGPEVLQLKEVPTPKPQANQVLVRLKAAGVNPVDTYFRQGGVYQPKLPWTPGMDGAGIVEEVGESIGDVKKSDSVYVTSSLTGTYAEYCLCEAWQVHALPDNVSFEEGAGIYVTYTTAYHALFHKARGRAGDKILVHGATGGVGSAAVQFARAAGMTVFGTAGSAEGAEFVRSLGAQHVFNHNEDGYDAQITKATGGTGIDIILEMLANENLDRDLSLIARGGRIVVIGSRGSVEVDPRNLMARDGEIHAMVLMFTDNDTKTKIQKEIQKGLADGSLKVIVGKTFPLAEAAKAHIAVMEPGAHGKIILLP